MAMEVLELEIRSNAQGAASGLEALGNALARLQRRVASFNYEELGTRFRNINKAIQEIDIGRLAAIGNAMEQISKNTPKGTSKQLREISRGMERVHETSQRASKSSGSFMKTVGRMALYRAIRGALKLLVQGIKEGVQNFAEWDRLTGQSTGANAIKTLNAYGDAFQRLKNTVGAAAIPLIQSFLPIVQTITSWVIAAINAINAFVSALRGLGSYFAASADSGYDMANSMSAAGGAASKLKNTILGFDELNVMDSPSGGGGGGGGGSAWQVGADSFLEMKIPDWMLELAPIGERIRDAFQDIVDILSGDGDGSGPIAWLLQEGTKTIADGLATSLEIIAGVLQTIDGILSGDDLSALQGFAKAAQSFLQFMSNSWGKISKFWTEVVGGSVGGFIGEKTGKLADWLQDLADTFGEIKDMNPEEWAAFKWIMKIKAESFWSKKPWDKWMSSLTKKFDSFKLDVDRAWGAVKDFFTGPWEFQEGALLNIGKPFEDFFAWLDGPHEIKGLDYIINTQLPIFWARTKFWLESRKNDIVKWFQGVISTVSEWVGNLVDEIKNKFISSCPDWLADILGIDKGGAGGGAGANTLKTIQFDTKLNLPPGGIEGFVKDRQAEADKEKPIGLKANIKQVDPPSNTPTIDVKASIESNVSGLKTQIQNAVAGLQARLGFKPYLVNTELFVKINSGFNESNQKISFRDITGYAEGGFPAAGLFFAGENGPELVGSIGGRTAVANSDQIIAGIASGVAAAMMGTGAKLDETNNLLRGMAERDSTVVVSTSDIAAGMSRMNRRAGATVMPVGA